MSEYNEDELEAPQWMNKEFFTEVLSSCEQQDAAAVKIDSFEILPATKKGDHYASVMFRAILKYQLNEGPKCEKSLIIKAMPDVDGQKKELLDETCIFETEIAMYTEVIPRFERILRAINDYTVLGTTCLYYSLSPIKLMVFEDLVPLGYTALRTQTTLEQAKCAYMKIAKWHAISFKIHTETPEYFDKFNCGLFNMEKMVNNDFFTYGITHFVELLQRTPSLHKYLPYFERLHDTLRDQCKASFDEYRISPRADAYYVLCHGDFHCKNMMLRTNAKTGQWEDIMLLDFQMCSIAPIAIDIIYSLFMLIDDNLRPAYIDELMHYYFQIFSETLKKIGYKGVLPEYSKFREQLFWHRHWEMFLLSTFLPVWDGFRDGSLDADEMLTSKEYAKTIYKNQKYIDELHVLLARYDQLGYFKE